LIRRARLVRRVLRQITAFQGFSVAAHQRCMRVGSSGRSRRICRSKRPTCQGRI
jgi:hypothetical protein